MASEWSLIILISRKKKNDLLSYENLQDALTDFFHLCDREGLDVDELFDGARANWVNERDPALDDEAPLTSQEVFDMIEKARTNPPSGLQLD